MKVQLNSVFKDFNRTKCRYRLAKGSAQLVLENQLTQLWILF